VVERAGRCVLGDQQSLRDGGWPRSLAWVVVFEQYQFLHQVEAEALHAMSGRGSEGARADAVEPVTGELVGPPQQVGDRGQPVLLVHDQLGDTRLAGPLEHAAGHALAAQSEGTPDHHGRDGSVSDVTVLFATHAAYLDHLAGPRHPERPERLGAVLDGVAAAGLADAMVPVEPRFASRDELELVHPDYYLDRIEGICRGGGGRLDPDTYASAGSWNAARLAAGAGLAAVDALREGRGDAAFCAVRPPGHHASNTESMGFCFVNNVAVVAATLAEAGEKVLVFDYDAHHGNGTHDIFYADPRVLFVSIHQWPLYPGTGRHDEIGSGAAIGTTMNIPVPPDTTGDVYLAAFDELVAPLADRFAPTWVIVSAGFDAHRSDPITDLGLSAGDYAPLTARVLSLVPAGRRIVMLEGGYDLSALQLSTATVMRELAGVSGTPFEAATSGGPGMQTVGHIRDFWVHEGLL
jgi:acetoin utilization deacetylase AcuC-like enzyme